MRFVINQKLLSIAGKYFIKDELGNDAFVVKGNFSLPRKYRVYDMQDNEIVRIKKRMFRLLPRFDYYKGDTMVCYAKRKFSFKPKYEFFGIDVQIEGSFFAFNYKVVRDGVVIASVYKAVTFMRDSYVVDIFDAANIPLALAIAVMFDHVHHRGGELRHNRSIKRR